MPLKNNRNSRDDKSKKFRSTPSSSNSVSKTFKSGRSDASNSRKKKLFDSDTSPDFKRSGKPFNSYSKNTDKTSDSGDLRNEKRNFSDKKEFGSAPGKAYGNRDKKNFPNSKRDSDSGNFRGERNKFGNKNYKDSDFRKGQGYKKSSDPEKRNWSSEEKIERGNLRAKKSPVKEDDGLIRLNRYIANAGVCSRRKADELIQAGVVSVNGEVVSELGYKVNPAKDVIRYNGEVLKREKMVYVLLNKPKDYITTTDDPQERRTVMQLVEKASKERIYPVGRLDRNTTGLLLMTNDGDLAEKLSHPRNNITKIYQVELNRNLTQGDLNKIDFGLELEDGIIKPDAISYVQGGSKREVGIQIHSGKNRIVRRIFEHLGYDVIKLDRVVYGNLTKKDLPRGRWRYLEEKEIIQLKHLIN
ncbi:pseudouridine synthase [Rubrolithibacter danxiaensis]|uniref:pseudouridine synthase n=1 Tax=Rubrolithibacter danxiaensis TaxID=3390805 RepID=UPI003BF8B145